MPDESAFVGVFEAVARDVLGTRAVVQRKAKLFYEMFLDRRLAVAERFGREPQRGSSAFEADICIFEKLDGIDFPRIVIEFKEKITTHDVLTYSAKAGKHKQIYPCLRYGMLASNEASIPGRFFVHNENLDFFVAAKNYSDNDKLRGLARDLIEKELVISRTLEDIHFANRKVDYYCRDIVFRNFGEVQ